MSFRNEVEIKGGMYTFMSIKLHTTDLAVIDVRLAEKVQQAPAFFSDTPVVLDLAALESESQDAIAEQGFDTARLLEIIRQHRLLPIVARVVNKTSPLAGTIALPLIESGARRQNNAATGLSSTTGDDAKDGTCDESASEARHTGSSPETSSDPYSSPGSPAERADPTTARALDNDMGDTVVAPGEIEYVIKSPTLIDRPVRSGQQIYARDTDLIIMGQVGAGAEVVADNNIHVYGPLRGRALCGVSGNTATRIFCQSLEAELVSVAGNFRLLENIPDNLRGKPAQIRLDNDRLNIEPL